MSKQERNQRPSSMVSETSTTGTTSTVEAKPGPKIIKSSNKVHSFGKRDQAIRRNPNVPVVVRGWLHKQDSSGMRLWKRRWFVLADYCLFYYKAKDSREEVVLGSIPLPSYVTSPVGPEDRISRKYSFKAEQSGMRTYYFSADTLEDMNAWVRAMNQAAQVLSRSSLKRVPFDVRHEIKEAQTANVQVSPLFLRPPFLTPPKLAEGFALTECAVSDGRCCHHPHPSRGDFAKNHSAEARGPSAGQACGSFILRPFSSLARPPGSGRQDAQPQRAEKNGIAYGPGEQNGTGGYPRAFPPRANHEKHSQRKSSLAQVEHWAKSQKGDGRSTEIKLTFKSFPPDQTLPRHGPSQPLSFPENYQTLPRSTRHPSGGSSPPPRNLPSDYKYAQDRASHLKMSSEERRAHRDGTVWQLYEWQQRQQFRHGSPTAPIPGPRQRPCRSDQIWIPNGDGCCPIRGVFLQPRILRLVLRSPWEGMLGRSKNHSGEHSSSAECQRLGPPAGKPARGLSPSHITRPPSGSPCPFPVPQILAPDRSLKPMKIAESDIDVKLSIFCEQDRILQDLEDKIRALKENKDQLESVLEVLHRQMEQYRDQPQHLDKIACQQRLLQEDLVHIRAELSRESTEMENAWNEYLKLESDVAQLKQTLQEQKSPNNEKQNQKEKSQIQKDLWRIEDVTAGLSANKENFRILVESVKNPGEWAVSWGPVPRQVGWSPGCQVLLCVTPPGSRSWFHPILCFPLCPLERKTVPLFPHPPVPSLSTSESKPPPQPSPPTSPVRTPLEVRLFPQLQTYLPYRPHPPQLRKVTSPLQSPTKTKPKGVRRSIGSTLTNGKCNSKRPKSALERLYSGDHQRGKMSAEEQLERMKRHQKALVRERKRTLSQGVSALKCQLPNPFHTVIGNWKREQDFDLQLLDRAVQGERKEEEENGWLKVQAVPVTELDLEPQDYDLDISRELSKPEKVSIPERYVDLEPEEPPSLEELQARYRKAEKIRSILTRSSMCNLQPASGQDRRNSVADLDSQIQEQERIINISYALASEASQRSKQVA
uniref:Pleckstrin homology domain containing A7 n=1 Tax=Myotis lucifugus TaxID=59463 RepID=G1NVY7_MYOLU